MTKRICPNCGGTEFYAHQICRIDIVVDGSNTFLRNDEDSCSNSIYDSETPYGPYTCVRCSAEFDELEDMQYFKKQEKMIHLTDPDDTANQCDILIHNWLDITKDFVNLACKSAAASLTGPSFFQNAIQIMADDYGIDAEIKSYGPSNSTIDAKK